MEIPMNPWECRREFRRIPVSHDHTVRFRLRGKLHEGVRIANLSAGGCFAILVPESTITIREGTILVDFTLEHSELPSTSIVAKIVRVVNGLAEITENDIGLGILFLSTSARFTDSVESYVTAHEAMLEKAEIS
jgi:c-di-GMP-binding flagellar brake protein YcgR